MRYSGARKEAAVVYDVTLAGLLEDALAGLGAVTSRKMFGGVGYFVDGEMFACVWQSNVILKLSEPDRAEALAMPGGSTFDPAGGRPMKQLVVLSEDLLDDATRLREWARRSHGYARTLAGKPKMRK